MEGWAVVIPATPAETAETARELLALAVDPSEVQTQRGGTEFLVPEALAEAYRKSVNPAPRRGRPKKETG